MQGQDHSQHRDQGRTPDSHPPLQPRDAGRVLRRLAASYPSNTDEYAALIMAASMLKAQYEPDEDV